MRLWGLLCQSKGWRGNTQIQKNLAALNDVSNLTCMEIAKLIGSSEMYAYVLLKRGKIRYKRARVRNRK